MFHSPGSPRGLLAHIALLLFPLALVLGCAHTSGEGRTDLPLAAAFHVTDAAGRERLSFTAGEPVRFELRIHNTTDQDVTYQATGPGHDFLIRRSGVLVWSRFHGRFFAQVIAEHAIEASATLVLGATWTGHDNQGNPVPAGTYEVAPSLSFAVDGEWVPTPAPTTLLLK